MLGKDTQKLVIQYYNNPESWIGYKLFLSGSQHFGYYPLDKKVSEAQAQKLCHDYVAHALQLQPGQLVLDAGCGQGFVALDLVQRYHVHVTGITIVPREVQDATRARTKLPTSTQEQATFLVMDYSHTSFAENSFDCIYTTETLSHSPDLVQTMTEFYHILKPGGRCCFLEYKVEHLETLTSYEQDMYTLVKEGSAMMGLNQFENDTFTSILSEAGFTHIEATNLTAHMEPSFTRLYNIAKWGYYAFIKPFHLQKYFTNATAAVEYYHLARKGIVSYYAYTCHK